MRIASDTFTLAAALAPAAVIAATPAAPPDITALRTQPAHGDDRSQRIPCVRIGSLPTCFPVPPAAAATRSGSPA